MSLRFALLSLLTGRPMTGYQIGKAFAGSVGHVWHAPDSQIYPELRRMADDGLLDCTESAKGLTMRKVYSVSDAGREALRAWLNDPVPPIRSRDPQFLRAAYLDWADPAAARAQLRTYLEFYEQEGQTLRATRASLLDGTHPTLKARLQNLPTNDHERVTAFKVFAYDGMIRVAEEQAAWAQRGLDLIDRLEEEPNSVIGQVAEDPPRRPDPCS